MNCQTELAVLSLGQSLSANVNGPPFRPAGHVSNLNIFDGKCYAAADPLLGTTGNGGSYLSRLGALLADKDRDVLIVP